MKTVHINKEVNSALHSYHDFLNEATEQEKMRNFKDAILFYKKCIQMKRATEFSYDRIMIIYRKQKEYDKERRFILDAINVFENFYHQKRVLNSSITRLSKGILRSTGLTDQKGKPVFDHQPIKKWKGRLNTVNKRLGKK